MRQMSPSSPGWRGSLPDVLRRQARDRLFLPERGDPDDHPSGGRDGFRRSDFRGIPGGRSTTATPAPPQGLEPALEACPIKGAEDVTTAEIFLSERDGTRSPADASAEQFHRDTACASCATKTDPCAGPNRNDQPSHASPSSKQNASSKMVIRRIGMRVEVDIAAVTVSWDRQDDAAKCRGCLGRVGSNGWCWEQWVIGRILGGLSAGLSRQPTASSLLRFPVWPTSLTPVVRRE